VCPFAGEGKSSPDPPAGLLNMFISLIIDRTTVSPDLNKNRTNEMCVHPLCFDTHVVELYSQ